MTTDPSRDGSTPEPEAPIVERPAGDIAGSGPLGVGLALVALAVGMGVLLADAYRGWAGWRWRASR